MGRLAIKPGAAPPLFLIGAPYDGNPHASGNGQMVALSAPGRAAVRLAHALALQRGGTPDAKL